MHTRYCFLVAVGLFISGAAHGANDVRLEHPQSHQVIQRIGLAPGAGYADVRVSGALLKGAPNATWEYRVVLLADGSRDGGEWTEFTPTLANDQFEGSARVAAGGWYRLEVRCRGGADILGTGAVEPIGVGEVFVVAGQSYATNCNDERLIGRGRAASRRRVRFGKGLVGRCK